MKVELIIPIDCLRGRLRKDGYFFRLYRDLQIVQKCPMRTKHERTPDEIANQKRFGAISREVNRLEREGDKRSHKTLWQWVSQTL